MSILPGLDFFNRLGERSDNFAGMISDLIEQANANYLHYLAAAATTDVEQVWQRYHESFASNTILIRSRRSMILCIVRLCEV